MELSYRYRGLDPMGTESHWEKIYAEKDPKAVSWFRPHLETSLEIIGRLAPGRETSIIDVGGGESTLVDDLLVRGYENLTVLDISQTAIDANKKRLGKASERVHWLAADITKVELEPSTYDLWHDRAVFHFLTSPHPTVLPTFARWPARFGTEAMWSSAPSVRRDPQSAAVLTLFAMTQSRCTENLAFTSACWEAQRKRTRHHLGRSSSSCTAIAGSNRRQRCSGYFCCSQSDRERQLLRLIVELALSQCVPLQQREKHWHKNQNVNRGRDHPAHNRCCDGLHHV